jgi:protein TonB
MALRGEHFIGLTVAISLHAGLAAALTLSTPAEPLDIKLALGFEMVELAPQETAVTPSTPVRKAIEATPIKQPSPEPVVVAKAETIPVEQTVEQTTDPIIPERVEEPLPEIATVAAPEPIPSEVQQAAPSTLSNTSDALTAEQAKTLPLMMASIDEEYIPPVSHSRYLHNPKPRYPSAARKRGMEGVVMINVRVGRDGQPLEALIHTSSGYGVLDRAALKAVRSWRFEAARRGNTRVEGEVLVPINFELKNS